MKITALSHIALPAIFALSVPAQAETPHHGIRSTGNYHGSFRGKTVLVTGASSGVGLALCKSLTRKGARVIATVRESSPALEALVRVKGPEKIRIIPGIDLGKDRSVKTLTKTLGAEKLDLLINVAGIIRPAGNKPQSSAAMLKEYQINALGPKRVVEALDKNLRPGAKIAMISSQWGSVAETLEGKVPHVSVGYNMSKAALNMYGADLAVQVKDRKITVGMFNPGWVRTAMGGKMGELSPRQAAQKLLNNISRIKSDNSGSFWDITGEPLPW